MLKQLRLKTIRNCQFRKIIAMGNFVRYVIHRLRKEDRTVLSYRLIPIYQLSEIPLQKDYQNYQVSEDSYDDVDEWLEEIMND